ncbi:MAG: hypothetical protein K6U89_15880, partial [Chloroflexi bacterium]|nr:hypothetical protein [Chloroflexota bacterium]
MELLALAWDYHQLGYAARAQLARTPAALTELLTGLVPGLAAEALVLSTCNRLELYALAPPSAADRLEQLLVVGCYPPPVPAQRFAGAAAVIRIFRLAAGLESQVVGEAAILEQLQDAYRLARRVGAGGPVMNALLQRAVRVGRRCRALAGFSPDRSVARAAVMLLGERLGGLAGRTVAVIGCGASGQQAARALQEQAVGRLVLVNRNHARAEALARQLGGVAYRLDEIALAVRMSEGIISTSWSTGYLLHPEQLSPPVTLVDLAVPPNVNPAVRALPGVTLLTLDDLPFSASADQFPEVDALILVEAATFEHWRTGTA